jgi:hypothetical protein
MSELSLPKIPQYRMTLFYGPEQDESDSEVVYCVFNVKKRSWKGGVQVAVELKQSQVKNIRDCFNIDRWLQASLSHLPPSEQEDYFDRGQDIVIQQVCLVKLQLAIEGGIRQENSRIAHDMLVAELDEVLEKEEVAVKKEVLQELDIELPA